MVSVDGTSLSTTTDQSGAWNFPNLSPGTYTFTFSKTGYGTFKVIDATVMKGAVLSAVFLYPIPKSTVTISLDSVSVAGIYWSGKYSSAISTETWIRFFFSHTTSVSANPANYVFDAAASDGQRSGSSFNFAMYNSLYGHGFAKGDTVYAVAYTDFLSPRPPTGYSPPVIMVPGSFYTVSYPDVATGRSVFPNLNPTPSNVIKFALP